MIIRPSGARSALQHQVRNCLRAAWDKSTRIGQCLGLVAEKMKPVTNAWALAITIVFCTMGRLLLGPRFQMCLDVVVIAIFVVQWIYVLKDLESWAPRVDSASSDDSEYAKARHQRFLNQRRAPPWQDTRGWEALFPGIPCVRHPVVENAWSGRVIQATPLHLHVRALGGGNQVVKSH
jgi:hypothetical protein